MKLPQSLRITWLSMLLLTFPEVSQTATTTFKLHDLSLSLLNSEDTVHSEE